MWLECHCSYFVTLDSPLPETPWRYVSLGPVCGTLVTLTFPATVTLPAHDVSVRTFYSTATSGFLVPGEARFARFGSCGEPATPVAGTAARG